jgi:hypothetical protein
MINITFKSAKKLEPGDSVTLITTVGGMRETKENRIVSKIDQERNIYLRNSDKVFNYRGEQINEDTDTRFRRKCVLDLKNYSV